MNPTIWDRVRVVLTAAVTYITLLQAGLVIFADEIGQMFADGQAAQVVNIIVRAGAILTGIVAIIRRVTPVLPAARGLAPPSNVRRIDRGGITLYDIVLVAVLVCAVLGAVLMWRRL